MGSKCRVAINGDGTPVACLATASQDSRNSSRIPDPPARLAPLLQSRHTVAGARHWELRVAEFQRFPPSFHTEEIETDGATIYVRIGGQGSAIVMLHGFGDTGDMWAPLAAALMHDHTVIVPDLRGMGLSSHPEDSYDKKTQEACDVPSLVLPRPSSTRCRTVLAEDDVGEVCHATARLQPATRIRCVGRPAHSLS
jgi:Alpha/beta hydrolase family